VALRECIDCSRQISTDAAICPACGAYQHRKAIRRALWGFIGFISVGALALFVLLVYLQVHG
jgi:predicted nucleic acid-binding Zn ribbon protein